MDVVDGCAPFVLTMTLECSPDDTESLLGFKPQNGTNYYGLYDFPDKRCYYNIMRGMGTLIVNILTGAIVDDGFEIEKPTLMSATVSGKNETSFVVELEFTLFVNGVNSSDDADKVHDKLVAAFPDGWEIKQILVGEHMNAKDTIDIQVSFGMDLEADDVLQMLGVVPKDGLCEFGLYDIPNRDLFHNIEHTFGTYVKSVLTRGIGDCWGLDINKPVLDGIETHGSYKTFFYVCPLFTVTLTFNSIDAAEKFSDDDLKLVIAEIAKSLPSNMLIGAVAVNKS